MCFNIIILLVKSIKIDTLAPCLSESTSNILKDLIEQAAREEPSGEKERQFTGYKVIL